MHEIDYQRNEEELLSRHMVGYVTYCGIFWLCHSIKLRLQYVDPQASFDRPDFPVPSCHLWWCNQCP